MRREYGIMLAGALVVLAALVPLRGAAQENIRVYEQGDAVLLESSRVQVRFDLKAGTYRVRDLFEGITCLEGAYARVGEWATNQPGYRHTWSSHLSEPLFGTGLQGITVRIRSARSGSPTLLLDLTLYPFGSFLTLAAGLENASGRALRVREMTPLAGGEAFPGLPAKRDFRTLDGAGGAGETRVLPGPARSSPNNLLLTFTAGGRRRSLVMGGLTYREWLKFAAVEREGWTEADRQADLRSRLEGPGRLAAWLDCGAPSAAGVEGGPALSVASGQPFAWSDAEGVAPAWFGSVAFGENEVILEASGLDPRKSYTLGFSWWDFDANGRRESVSLLLPDGARRALLPPTALPAWKGASAPPQERALPLPKEAYADGRARIVFANEAAVPNAVVSEAWLWEGDAPPALKGGMARGEPSPVALAPADTAETRLPVRLLARDPLGRLVAPGERYMPEDAFYLDAMTPGPFEALEAYGLRLRIAQRAYPHPYDFPTVCGWYVGIFTPKAGVNQPGRSRYPVWTSAGMAEEAAGIQASGFLNYARAAVRLVPDTYTADNEQGWWDDAHWRKLGHYVPPCETTGKFGAAVRRHGCLPFTYFQCVNESQDFRRAHPEMLLANDPQRGLDYTDPATQAHMRGVYANLRAGGVAGMMFDYPNDMWAAQTVRGGFADPRATAAAAYRALFRLAKEGLGPDSWIHERVLGDPNSDLTAGVVDSQRVWGDTSAISPEMVTRCGLRWYKNRTVFAYDMDAKDLLNGWKGLGPAVTDTDGRRMLLTMAYVAGSRLLLATSFRDMSRDTLHDLERTFPYPDALQSARPDALQSARPVDAFCAPGPPQVYDFAVTPDWHQVTLFNAAQPAREAEIRVALSGDPAGGALDLDPTAEYYAYDFWNDRFAGRLRGSDRLAQTLRPGEARMLSLHRVEDRPQFLSTNRHLMQGYVDMAERPAWNAAERRLEGASRVVGGEPYVLVLALNGFRPLTCAASAGTARVETLPGPWGLAALTLDSPKNAVVRWSIPFAPERSRP